MPKLVSTQLVLAILPRDYTRSGIWCSLATPMTDPAEIKSIIQRALATEPEGRRFFKERAIQRLAEVTETLQAEGVPNDVLAILGANALSRILGPSPMDIARSLFPIESLPDGAIPVYDRDPDVAEMVAKTEEE